KGKNVINSATIVPTMRSSVARHRGTMKPVEESRKSGEDLISYHDTIHRGHDEAKLHAVVAMMMGAMDAQKSPKPS
ncbi:hypothetical protein L195_g059640, partial [Trifolium pratense]